jgi:hypothetical protein
MEVTAIGKYKYFLILVDDYSGFTKAFPLIDKFEALKFYKCVCEHSCNLLNKRVTYLKFDNSKEFISKECKEYPSDQGTVLDEIPDYTPQLNGTAERNIRTVMNMMRSMLKAAELPRYLLAEAICAACYIKNRFTSSKKSTPFELWFGQKSDICHFRIYG